MGKFAITMHRALNWDEYTLSGKAKTDLIVLRLPYDRLYKLRQKHEKLHNSLWDYEEYIDENRVPYCDFKLYRGKFDFFSPREIFEQGIKRWMRIVKSYKTFWFTDLLKDIKASMNKNQHMRQKKLKEMLLNGACFNEGQRNEQAIMLLSQKVERLTDIVGEQNETINVLQNEVLK